MDLYEPYDEPAIREIVSSISVPPRSLAPERSMGVGTMIENRCKEAGLLHSHPHQFRHTFAHLWKVNGGNADSLMRITGWKSRQMLSRYAASSGAESARQAHRSLSPGDRL
jgi:integrase